MRNRLFTLEGQRVYVEWRLTLASHDFLFLCQSQGIGVTAYTGSREHGRPSAVSPLGRT